jgi:hypothetical protein
MVIWSTVYWAKSLIYQPVEVQLLQPVVPGQVPGALIWPVSEVGRQRLPHFCRFLLSQAWAQAIVVKLWHFIWAFWHLLEAIPGHTRYFLMEFQTWIWLWLWPVRVPKPAESRSLSFGESLRPVLRPGWGLRPLRLYRIPSDTSRRSFWATPDTSGYSSRPDQVLDLIDWFSLIDLWERSTGFTYTTFADLFRQGPGHPWLILKQLKTFPDTIGLVWYLPGIYLTSILALFYINTYLIQSFLLVNQD